MLIAVIFFAFNAFARQEKNVFYAIKIEQRELLDSLKSLLLRQHVKPEEAKLISEKLQEKFDKRTYAPYTANKIEFIEALSLDLQQIAKNPSFRLSYTGNIYYQRWIYPSYTFKLPLPRTDTTGTLFLERPLSFFSPADYDLRPKGRVPAYLYGKEFQEKMQADMFSYAVQIFGVQADKLNFSQYQESPEKVPNAIIVNKKWLRKYHLTDWNGTYFLPYRQWAYEIWDTERHRPFEYLQKKGKKTLFAKMTELKQNFRNNGFGELRNEEGGIAYLRINAWAERAYSDKNFIFSAMAYLAQNQAIIIDLRQCHEGGLSVLPEFCAYFLEKGKCVSLANIGGKEIKTLKKLKRKAPRLLSQKIYILSDSGTSNASDVLIYFLKKYKNATLVGTHLKQEGAIFNRFMLEKNRIYADIPVAKIELPDNNFPEPDIFDTSDSPESAAKVHFFKQKLEKTHNTLSLIYYRYLTELENGRKNSQNSPKDSLHFYQGNFSYGKKIILENHALYLCERSEKRRLYYFEGSFTAENAFAPALLPTDFAHPAAGMPARIGFLRFFFNKKSGRFDAEVTYTNGEKDVLISR